MHGAGGAAQGWAQTGLRLQEEDLKQVPRMLLFRGLRLKVGHLFILGGRVMVRFSLRDQV